MPNKNRLAVNYAAMTQTAKVVILGEAAHHQEDYKNEVIRAIKDLKVLGFTHLAMEMLPLSAQHDIDVYNRTGTRGNKILSLLQRDWSYGASGSIPGALFNILAAARTVGMKIVPLDMPYELMQSIDRKCSNTLHRQGRCEDSHLSRNSLWTKSIASLVEQGNKVVCFTHYLHGIRRWENDMGLRTLLNNKGISSVVIKLDGGVYCPTKTRCEQNSQSEEEPYNKQRFYFKVNNLFTPSPVPGVKYQIEHADFIVHLPEINR